MGFTPELSTSGTSFQTTPGPCHLSAPIWGQISISSDLQGAQTRKTNCHFKGVLRYTTMGKSLFVMIIMCCMNAVVCHSFAYALIHIMYGEVVLAETN